MKLTKKVSWYLFLFIACLASFSDMHVIANLHNLCIQNDNL